MGDTEIGEHTVSDWVGWTRKDTAIKTNTRKNDLITVCLSNTKR